MVTLELQDSTQRKTTELSAFAGYSKTESGALRDNYAVVRALTESFDSQVSWCGESLSSATRQVFELTEGWPTSSQTQAKCDDGQQASRGRP